MHLHRHGGNSSLFRNRLPDYRAVFTSSRVLVVSFEYLESRLSRFLSYLFTFLLCLDQICLFTV